MTVDIGLDVRSKVLRVLDDASEDEPLIGAPRDLDGDVGTLVGVDAAKKQQVVAARGTRREFLQIDAVVNGSRVVEIRVAVGGADGHQMADVVVRR